MSSQEILERRQAAVPRGIGNVTRVVMARSEGALLWDPEGKKYIDFAGGIGVNNVGHRHPKVVQALVDQLERFIHPCFHVTMYEGYVELAERLNALVPVRGPAKTMLANSGAEAVENAVKIARFHTGRQGVVCFEGGFHGRTLMAMALTSKVMPYKHRLGAMVPGVFRAHFPYCYRCPFGLTYPACGLHCGGEYLEGEFFKYHVAADEVAAVIIEPVQGEGGFIHPPQPYMAQLRDICDRHGMVLIVDEVQTGFGRTGRMFAVEHYGIEPDIMTLAKSLGGGLPISAVTGTAAIMDSVHVGGLGGTYGGNPLSCAAALAVLGVMEEEGLVERARQLGEKARAYLDDLAGRFPIVGDVRGLGAMLALELVKDRATKAPAAEEAKRLTAWCHEHGLLILDCGTLGNNIRTLMPLVISDAQLAQGMDILARGLAAVSEG